MSDTDLIRRGDVIREIDCGGCYGSCTHPSSCQLEDVKTIRALPAVQPAPVTEAHDEQLGVWADELIADLILGGLMDLVDHEYDTKVAARRQIIASLKMANAARAPQPAPVTVERVQHIKRGTTYTIIARGVLQTDHPLYNYADLVVYRCDETDDTWIRPQSEFTPDRFRALAGEKPNE